MQEDTERGQSINAIKAETARSTSSGRSCTPAHTTKCAGFCTALQAIFLPLYKYRLYPVSLPTPKHGARWKDTKVVMATATVEND